MKPPKPKFKTLIVEDDITSRIVLQEFLSRYGEVDVAADGAEAVSLFKAGLKKSGVRYNLVCLDLGLPKMDGRAVLAEIRKAEEKAKIPAEGKAKIIITTASRSTDNIAWALQEHCDGYLVKPFHKLKLIELLHAFKLVD